MGKVRKKSRPQKKVGLKQKSSATAGSGTLNRQVLFRPQRYQYVRKLIPSSGCVFCAAAKDDLSFESLCVFKSEHSMVILNKFPYNSGHLLVLPLSHKGSLLELTEPEFLDLHLTIRKAVKAIEEIYQPAALNLGLNHGKAAGAGLPDHLHYHVIPRWEGDLNFFPLVADTKVVIESLDQTYRQFRKYFKESP